MSLRSEVAAPVFHSVGALRRGAAETLRAAGVEGAELDARVLLAHILAVEPGQMLAMAETAVDAEASRRFSAAIARRAAGEPVARIVGRKEFWSRTFVLSPHVLVPRPETETLVEAALVAKPDRAASFSVLDLGIGSGVLLASILLERPRASGVGVDRSADALAVARANLDALGVGTRARLIRGDWGSALAGRFDLVVTNPPYIANGDIAGLPREVREHDPMAALDGGTDGLAAYRAILPDLVRLLAPDGMAVLELGDGLEGEVAALARSTHLLVNEHAHCDLSGRPRALIVSVARGKKTLGRGREPH